MMPPSSLPPSFRGLLAVPFLAVMLAFSAGALAEPNPTAPTGQSPSPTDIKPGSLELDPNAPVSGTGAAAPSTGAETGAPSTGLGSSRPNWNGEGQTPPSSATAPSAPSTGNVATTPSTTTAPA